MSMNFSGRTDTAVNDRSRSPCTTVVYGAERQETYSVYDRREKIQRFGKVIFDTPFTEINGDKRLSYTAVCDRIR
jgi:hypothetical protein